MNAKYAIMTAAAAVTAIAAGCTVGPDYKRPEVMVPGRYDSPRPATTTATQPAAIVELAQWWESLGDPQLTSLIARATAANLDLKVAKQRVREARALRGVSESQGLPQVDATATYSRSIASDNAGVLVPAGGYEPGDLFTAGFDAAWELDVFGGVRRSVEAADAEVVSSMENLRDVLTTLQSDVATNYTSLRVTQQRLAVARNAATVQREAAELASAKLKAGLVNELDVSRADAQVAATEAQIPALEASIRTSMHRLAVLLGCGPTDVIPELEMDKPIPVPQADIPPGQPGDLLRRRPDIRRAEADLWAATASIGVATADLYPRFSLVGDLGLQSNLFRDWWRGDSRFWSIGPQVSWSILNGGRVKSNIEVQNARQQQALLDYQQTILLAVEEVENGLTRYAHEQRRRATLQQAVDASQRAVDLATELYTRGLTDFTAVILAERDLQTNQDLLVVSQGNVTTYAISVYKAMGGGWVVPVSPTTMPTGG